MRSCGLDISTYTGMALVGDDEDRGKVIHLPQQRGFLRLQLVAAEVERTLLIWKPEVVMVEGYAYCKNIHAFVVLVEVGTVIREVLYRLKLGWYEVPPSTLKKWAVGKGNASKDQMAAAVKTRWGFESNSDDIVDAYALGQLGQLSHEELEKIPGILSWGWGN